MRKGLSYGWLAARRRAREMVLPAVTTATGAFLVVIVFGMAEGIRAQSASLGHADEIGRAVGAGDEAAGVAVEEEIAEIGVAPHGWAGGADDEGSIDEAARLAAIEQVARAVGRTAAGVLGAQAGWVGQG